MDRRRSQKNKNTPPKENNEVTLEILLSDCSNYDSWSTRVLNAFRTVDPQLEQILDKSVIPSSYDRKNASEEDLRCIRLNYLAYDILSKSLSKEDYRAFIMRYDEPICDAHDIWTRIKIKFDESKHNGSFDTSTSSSCETNTLNEEEENERWRPNDESTSPKGLFSNFNSHICCVANENDSRSTNEDEMNERSSMQLYAHLSLEDKAVMLKLLKRKREQSEARQMLEDILSIKMLSFDELTKEHEELKRSHVDLVQRYETISIEQDNSLYCIAQLVNRNAFLKDQVEKLKVENLAFQEKHDMLLCSHENLMDDHIMLNIAHEVVIENLKSQQPHSCTRIQIETKLPCANACCPSTSKSSFELEFAGTKDDIYQNLKEENERLKISLTQLKGKCIAQPSQDNREHMVKKLETETTVACTKFLEENVKDLRIVKRKEQKKKINTSAKSLNHASMQGNIRGNNQVTLHTKRSKKCSECFEKVHSIRSCPYIKNDLITNKDDQLCFKCSKRGHLIKSCPYLKQKGIVLENKILTNHVASKKQGKKKSSRLEDRLCYICRKKGHQCKDCHIGNYSTSSLSIISHVTRQPKIATCARKVMSLPSTNTKDFWVPRSLLTNLDGPIKRWVPKYA
jgi:hypothetical protein